MQNYRVCAAYRSDEGEIHLTGWKDFLAQTPDDAIEVARSYFEYRYSVLSDGSAFLMSKAFPSVKSSQSRSGGGSQFAIGNNNVQVQL